jgi:hypothetical protein
MLRRFRTTDADHRRKEEYNIFNNQSSKEMP